MWSDSVIIGGGLAGLSLAINLSRSSKVLILESESNLGGLARSYVVKNVVFDFGPHVLRSNDSALINWISSLVKLAHYKTNPGTYKYGKIFDHVIPVITWNNIYRLPKNLHGRIKAELEQLNRRKGFNTALNFEEAIISQVGETLYHEFFGEYSRKWWGIEPRSLSAELAPCNLQISETSSYAHITTAFSKPRKEFYPIRGGYGSIADAIVNKLSKLRNVIIRTKARVTDIVSDGGKVSEVIINNKEELHVEGTVYSTIPLTDVASMLGISTDLKYRADICVFMVVKEEYSRNLDKSWLYFPESDIFFSRLCWMGHFSKYNENTGLRGFVAEITCFKGDNIWNMRDEDLVYQVLDSLLDIGFIRHDNIVAAHVVKQAYAYPLLTVNYDKEKRKLMNKLKEVASNLIPVGRTGSFKYWNSDAVLSLAKRLSI